MILASSLVVGLPIPTINSLLMGFVFAKVPSEMQGRVGSASDMLSMIPTLFCSALAGSLLPRIGFGATIGLFLAVLAVNVVIRAADAVDPLAPRRRPLGRRVAVTMHH